MEFPLQYSLPRHFCAIFLLVLALYTCLPLPTLLSIFFGILVSGLHIVALASRKESLQEKDHLRKVIANALLLVCGNLIGYYYQFMSAKAQDRTFEQTRSTVESR